jgi:predicted nucleotidyltransferase
MKKVMNKNSLVELLQANETAILAFGVDRIGIFGSFSRNEINESSDIDFFVEFKAHYKSFDNFMELAFFLEDLTGRKIELITSSALSPYLGPEILKEVNYVIAA